MGKYQVLDKIGQGGMGDVYQGYDEVLNRTVAIKVLAPHMSRESNFVRRFLREACTAGSLRHPNIVVIHDVGQQGDVYYFVMEYLEGESLERTLRWKGKFLPAEASAIVRQVASALDYARSRGVVHRDINPGNIMVDQGGHVTLTDFGIAKAAGTRLTETGTSLGTPEYMSPEQAKVREADKVCVVGALLRLQILFGEHELRHRIRKAALGLLLEFLPGHV